MRNASFYKTHVFGGVFSWTTRERYVITTCSTTNNDRAITIRSNESRSLSALLARRKRSPNNGGCYINRVRMHIMFPSNHDIQEIKHSHLVTLNTLRRRTHRNTLLPILTPAYFSSSMSRIPENTTCYEQVIKKTLLALL